VTVSHWLKVIMDFDRVIIPMDRGRFVSGNSTVLQRGGKEGKCRTSCSWLGEVAGSVLLVPDFG